MVSNLLHHSNAHKSLGPDGIHSRILKELAKVLAKPLSIIYQQSWIVRDISVDRKFSKSDTHLQERPEGGFRELQACQSNLSSREGHGANHLDCHHNARTGQPGDRNHSVWAYWWKSSFVWLTDPLWRSDLLSGWEKDCPGWLLHFSKAFDTFSSSILP